jgi:hypothetical protein
MLVPGMLWLTAAAPAAAQRCDSFEDVVFATVNGKPLALDLYMPANAPSAAGGVPARWCLEGR